jgi:hypothetical protein
MTIGLTVFPDFTNASTVEWLMNIAAAFYDIIPFDGIWNVRMQVLELVEQQTILHLKYES